MGSVGLQLTIGNGVHVDSLAWTISNGTNTYTGTVNITDDAGNEAQSIEFVQGGVLEGSGYIVTLSGADSAGDPCTGTSAPISVTSGATTPAAVIVTCTIPTDASLAAAIDSGNIAVDAGILLTNQAPFVCPGITGVAISPAELRPPEKATLTATTAGGSGGTSTLLWTSTCGTISDPTLPNATFACGAATGTCTVTLTAGLNGTGLDGGSVGQVCTGAANTSTSEVINCEALCSSAADCPASTTLCAVPACVAGRCQVNVAPEGTSCANSGGTICNGIGACIPFTFEVVRVGTGAAPAAGTVPVFVEQRRVSDGSVVTTVPLPVGSDAGGTAPLTLTPALAASTEGGLTRSADGRFLALAGYDAPTGTVSPGTSATVPRVIARIDASGIVDTSTVLVGGSVVFGGGTPRGVASLDGSGFWVAGTGTTTAGTWFVPLGAASLSQVHAGSDRTPGIFGGQLYADGDNGATPEIFTIGTGAPTSGLQTATELNGLPAVAANAPSPWSFAFFDLNPAVAGVDTLYVALDKPTLAADAGAAPPTGIQKWTFNGSAWSQVSVTNLSPAVGFRGLTGLVTGANTVTLIASTIGETPVTQNHVVVFTDNGTTVTAGTPVAAGTNMTFRGVALTPHH